MIEISPEESSQQSQSPGWTRSQPCPRRPIWNSDATTDPDPVSPGTVHTYPRPVIQADTGGQSTDSGIHWIAATGPLDSLLSLSG